MGARGGQSWRKIRNHATPPAKNRSLESGEAGIVHPSIQLLVKGAHLRPIKFTE